MTCPEINLARDMVLPKRKRLFVYHMMLLYILLSSVALFLAVQQAVWNTTKGIICYQKSKVIQKRFKESYPNQPDIKTFANRLLQTMEHGEQTAIAIHQALPPRIYSSLPVLTAIIHHAGSGSLQQMAFAQQLKDRPSLVFSIAVPVSGRTGPSSAFIRDWQDNPALTGQLSAITPTTTKRGRVENEDVFIMNYKGTFKE